MPMYEFKCNACKKVFEELVFGDPKSVPCPHCGSTNTQRLLSATTVRTGGLGGVGAGLGSSSASSCGGGGRFS